MDIHIGKPIANTQIYILDNYMQIVPIGIVGELCIAGDGVGAGYLNRPELTGEKFIDNPFSGGKLYKTGDLAYWREDGNIAYVGRNDFQVKIRGLRIELEEIENTITSIDNISQAAVVVRKNSEGRQLICAFYTGKEIGQKQIRDSIGKILPKYMLPHIITHLDKMPLTTSGKVNRNSLPDIDLEKILNETEYVAPQTEQQKILCKLIEDVLFVSKVGLEDNFFDMGGDSLKAIELISKLEESGYTTSVKSFLNAGSIKKIADCIEKINKPKKCVIKLKNIAASSAQMRVYTAQSMDEKSTMYNIPYAFRVEKIDSTKLQNAVDKLLKRHSILRTYFENIDGTVMQIINNEASCTVQKLSSTNIGEFIKPFDLSNAPLIRVGYCNDIVMIDIHHIIADGQSMPILIKELNEFYMGRNMTDVPIQYNQFAQDDKYSEKDEKYWISVYDEIPQLEINIDFKRGQKRSFEGAVIYDGINLDLHSRILKKCRNLNITPYVYYMSGFNILLSKYSGCEDISVGMPISGRYSKYLDTIGMFVNTIALRNKPCGEKAVIDFMEEVKVNSIEAIEHQSYPFGNLVKKLNAGSVVRNPIFDVMFAYQSEEMTDVYFADKKAELLPTPITTSKYDFTFNIMPRKEDVVLMVEYCTTLYKPKTIQKIINSYGLILEQMLNETLKIKDISAVSAEEEMLLYTFNNNAKEVYGEKYVHKIFEGKVKKSPNKEAVIASDKILTFDELNRESNIIAYSLIKKGIGVGDIVAFILQRNSYLISTMLGILKAGAAYLPIDSDYPQERIEYLLSESNPRYVIDENNINELIIGSIPSNFVCNYENELFCVLHTSGSTGVPKLTTLTHNGIVNFWIASRRFYMNVDTVVSTTILTFDAFIMDTIISLLNNKRIILSSKNAIYDQEEFEHLFKYSKNNMLFSTPTKLDSYISNSKDKEFMKNIKSFVIGGEVFPNELYSKINRYSENANVFNIYGPTETTICSVVDKISDEKDITIGKPIANTKIYIVDKHMHIVPIGVTGELCIAGDGVGAGYLNRPELTAEKFMDNPFGEGKLYKTGDLAYWREDGNIVYVGRNDFQVKIRGLRIELGEIETAMLSVDGILQAVVVVRKNAEGRQLICAFYTGMETDAREIREQIGRKLPKYMLPHVFTHLEKLPLTTSGKVNRKALPEINLESISIDTECVPPENQQQKELCRLIESVLGTTPVGITDDFFDLGGDSLKAIEFVSKAHSEGIYFNLQNVFDYPTVKQLCECIENGDKQNVSFSDVDFSKVNEILSKNTVENIIVPQKCDVGNILLAGATGYLGIHILENYLDNDSGVAYCLVRGKDKSDSVKRLKDLLEFYFGDKYMDTQRIEVICADLQKDKFGLADNEYENLFGKVDTVINCAASVKHYGSYKYFHEANVETTKRLIDFCRESGARLMHISTLSVSGNSFGDDFDGYISETEKHFYECNLYIDQPLDNVYGRSKFEAEKEVLDAMACGLQANIMRMGNLTNRLSDGAFQRNHESNAFLQRVKAVLELGLFPDYLIKDTFYAEFTPIDEASNAVMTIARHFSMEQTVFHINSIEVVHFDKLMGIFNQLGIHIKTVSGREFTEALRVTAKQSGMEHIFETFINDMDENDQLNYDSNIRIENDFTVQYLKQLGFEWSDIGIEYLRKYVDYFKKIGYFEV